MANYETLGTGGHQNFAQRIFEKVKALIDTKQNTLTFDATPTSGSTNPVTSGGIQAALTSAPLYGESTAGATTAAKTVTIAGISELTAGLAIRVKFTAAQTYNGTPTLNVNNLGARNIRRTGGTNAARYEWVAGEVLDLVYDGTYWVIVDGGIATTSYYGATKLYTGAASTSASYALTPASLNSFAQNVVSDYPVYSTSRTYAVGDRVRYSVAVYECTTAITKAEAWTAPHWQQVDALQTQVDALKSSVSSGKALVAAAVTDKGVQTAATDTFATMAANIRNIPAGSGTDTTDATLNSGAQLLSGVTAYSNGVKYTGTIATVAHSAPTASVNTSTGLVTASHTQAAGYVSAAGTTTGTLQLTLYSGAVEVV